MKRVLHVVAGLGLGGAETFLINIYRNIDREKVQFDFLTYYEKGQTGFYDDEVLSLGGHIHNIQAVKNAGIIKFVDSLRQVIREGNYAIVHAHTDYNIGFAMLAAKLEGVAIRITHSHSIKSVKKQNLSQKLYGYAMYYLINKYASIFCACSKKAASYLFSTENRDRYIFIPNAVDMSKFLEDDLESNKKLKQSLNIPLKSKIIGHVGRYGKAKNHDFIIDIFYELLQRRKDVYLLLIGDGPTRKNIQQKVRELNIENNVKILGLRKDIPALMSIMDVFILPSLYEGFGIVLLEAQASGLPCIVSEHIQPEPDMKLGLMHHVKLKNIEEWVDTIVENLDKKIQDKDALQKAIEQSPYKLEEVVKKFYDLYKILNFRT